MKKYLLLLLLLFLLLPLPVHAGMGYPVDVSLRKIDHQKKADLLQFAFLDPSASIFKGCPEFSVSVHYQRVPRYSFVPFVGTSHPSHRAHKKALNFLTQAYTAKQPIKLGFFGSGVRPTEQACHFESKGLMLFGSGQDTIVASFYDPV